MTISANSNQDKTIPDVQSSSDVRHIPIDKVGVKDITYPISLYCPITRAQQHTVANINMYVGLPHHQKGTHMSRFLEVLNAHHESLNSKKIMTVCHDIQKKLEAETAHIEFAFTYFIHKTAPVSGSPSLLDIEVTFECSSNTHDDFIMGVKVPATSLCPCSKEIADYGAHNQRCTIEAKVRFKKDQYMWIEDLFEIVEQAASTQVYSVLKRPDEKFVTEAAYDNPKFVEDIIRDLAISMDTEERITWYQINSENHESIHNHSAYAWIEKDKTK